MAFASLRATLMFLTCSLFLLPSTLGSAIPESHHYVQRSSNLTAPQLLNATNLSIHQAEQLLAAAIAQQGKYNQHRIANPRRNTYTRGEGTAHKLRKRDDEDTPQPPILSETLLAAAVLIAERDAAQQLANGTLNLGQDAHALRKRSAEADEEEFEKRANSYWVPQLASKGGLAPMGNNNSYPVYRDVTAYGAKGDGTTDDTQAINNAIAAGGNCGANCLSSSVKGTLIYFPPGTYLISSPINAYYYSQLVGDATNFPTIKTSASFVGLGAIQTDVYIPNGNGNEWYIEQSVFFRQVRNFNIDIRATTTASVAGLHWQVAQATSLYNVVIMASTASGDGNTQMGMFTENGSGGFMSDVQISGGAYGIYGGNQQYTVRSFSISGQTKACICLIWDWGWTWSNLALSNAPIGINMINPQDPNGQHTGSTYIMDSSFSKLDTGVYAALNSSILDSSIITLDNIAISNVNTVVKSNGTTQPSIPSGNINFIVLGNTDDGGNSGQGYSTLVPDRPANLTIGKGAVRSSYFIKSRPQYETLGSGSFLSAKDNGAKGDGVTDDTAAIQSLLSKATTSNVIYFPAGTYVITKPLFVSAGSRITGTVWSQLAAKGSNFTSMAHPSPMLRVGNPGDTGVVEISDMLFTSIGALPGLIMVEWNIAASSQGAAGMWDCHFRVGGAIGTQMQVSQCPLKASVSNGCIGANMIFHITPSGNGYFENVWAWVADHDIDDANNTMVGIWSARGILVESNPGPVWLYGSASEHSLLYQYNFDGSQNTWAGMIQTESPYFQDTAVGMSPGPFNSSIGSFAGDPNFNDGTCNGTTQQCDVSWAVMMQGTTNLSIAGAGLYSWFGGYGQDCVDAQNCQQRIAYDDGSNVLLQIWNLITIGSVEMISIPSGYGTVMAKPNTQSIGHPYWSALAGYLTSDEQSIDTCNQEDDPRPGCQGVTPLCDWTKNYTTITDISNSLGSMPGDCPSYYAINTLQNELTVALRNYTSVNNGYDKVFSYYVEYMKEIIPGVMSDFMQGTATRYDYSTTVGPGNQFFDCKFTTQGQTTTSTCPVPWNKQLTGNDFTIEYILKNSSGFYGTLASQYGFNSSWVAFQTSEQTQQIGPGCTSARATRNNYCNTVHSKFINRPVAASNPYIPNPKTALVQALPNITHVRNQMVGAQMDLYLGAWQNSTADDINQVFSLPVFTVLSAVDGMQTAKSLGQAQEKRDKIKILLEVLTAIFAIIPFLDELTPELAALDGIFTAVADAGQLGLTIQSIVADPSVGNIFGSLLGGFARYDKDINTIANARRALSQADRDSIGTVFKQRDDEFQNTVVRKCMD